MVKEKPNYFIRRERRDIEQIGASLTTTNDVLGRVLPSSFFI
jgi:hypothetical protein